jgi:hypothetical protein
LRPLAPTEPRASLVGHGGSPSRADAPAIAAGKLNTSTTKHRERAEGARVGTGAPEGPGIRQRNALKSQTTTQALPTFLTVKETADLLRTTPKAIYIKAERQQLPGAVRFGKRRLLIQAEVLLQSLHQ